LSRGSHREIKEFREKNLLPDLAELSVNDPGVISNTSELRELRD
jgi:hypothetical protein